MARTAEYRTGGKNWYAELEPMRTELTPSWFMAIDWTSAGAHRSARAGNFELRAPIGRGGMGEVWRAYHRGRDINVAIKFLLHELARYEEFQAEFRDEVRAVARLDHPGIIRVLDMGVLGREVEAATSGRIVAGSPFVAMELVPGGTLWRAVRKPLQWLELRYVLLEVLDALAHAHARGVIHRDLKPNNLLRRGATEQAGTVLTDFGIAHLMAEAKVKSEGPAVGTMAYMAPEQILAQTRDFGPWTDLFALGATAWELATGRPAFGTRVPGNRAAAFARLSEFESRIKVPEGFLEWLKQMMATSISARFRSASAAARSLAALPSDVGPPPMYALCLDRPDDRIEWRSARSAPATSLAGIGLGLYALRALPLVGREAERDVLFEALNEVVRDQRPRCVVVRGAEGLGVSRLLRYVSERVVELDAASVFSGSPRAGFNDRLCRHLGISSTQDPDFDARVRVTCGMKSELTEQVQSLCEEDPLHTLNVRQRCVLALQVLHHFADDAPMVLCFDDVTASSFGYSLARSCLERKDIPLLFVLGALPDAMDDDAVDVLSTQGRTRCIDLQPFGEAPFRTLLTEQLALADSAADRAAEETSGNPGHAIELVGQWIEDGALRLHDGVLVLHEQPGTNIIDASALWETRADRLLAGVSATEAIALELAGAFGAKVEVDLWKRAAHRSGASPSLALLDRLVTERLIEFDEPGLAGTFRFVHPFIRAALRRRAQATNRWAMLHRACAEELALVAVTAEDFEALAEHWQEAGETKFALDAFLEAAKACMQALSFGEAESLLRERDALAERSGIDEQRPERVEGFILLSNALRRTGVLPEAAEQAQRAHRAARSGSNIGLHAAAAHQRARIAKAQGQLEDAIRWLVEAEGRSTAAGDLLLRGHCRCDLGAVLKMRRDFERSDQKLHEAVLDYRAASALSECGYAMLLRGQVALRRNALDAAQEYALAALSDFQDLRARGAIPETAMLLGDIARARQDWPEAEQHYRAALEGFIRLGSDSSVHAELRLGMALASLGQFDEARVAIQGAIGGLEARGRFKLAQAWHLGLLRVTARQRSFRSWPKWMPLVVQALESDEIFDDELALAAELLAHEAHEAGRLIEACDALSIAARQYALLGDRTAAELASARLATWNST